MTYELARETRQTLAVQRGSRGRWPAYAALSGIGCCTLAILILHWFQPNFGLMDVAMSYYVHHPQGWLLTVGLLMLGCGSLALTAGLISTIQGRSARMGWWCLAVWSIAVMLTAIFPADPVCEACPPPSNTDLIHGNAGAVAVFALPAAAFLLGSSIRGNLQSDQISGILRFTAIGMCISLAALILSLMWSALTPGPSPLFGFVERIYFAAAVGWLGAAATGLLRMTRR